MPSPTTARGLLGTFLHGIDLPAVGQRVSPPPVWSPTYSALREISAAGAGGGGARGGAGGRKSPMYSRGADMGAGGRPSDRSGENSGKSGAARGEIEETESTVLAESRRGRKTEDPTGINQDNDAGGEYGMVGTDTEDIAADSAEWSREETDELVSEEESDTA